MADVFVLNAVGATNFRCSDDLTVTVDPEVTVVVADNGGGLLCWTSSALLCFPC